MNQMRRFFLIALSTVSAMGLGGCSTSQKAFNDSEWIGFEEYGLAISYPKRVFEFVKLYQLPKKVDDGHVPFAVGPQRWVIHFRPLPTGRVKLKNKYYFPSEGNLYITPLTDHSVDDFSMAYPFLRRSAAGIAEWLREGGSLPSGPFNNAARAIKAKVKWIDSLNLHGGRCLTYYVNGKTGYGATNAELTYDFQGVTKDGRFYVSARLGVRHSKLPESMKDPRSHRGSSREEDAAEEKRINGWKDDTFDPNLAVLDAMIRSLRIDPKGPAQEQ